MKGYYFHSILFCLFLSCATISAQSPGYTIESFLGDYIELPTYHSIGILTGGDPLWEYQFQLEFPFPFYDSSYTRIYYEQDSWGSFTDDQDLALYLFHANWTYENILDTANITSDVRFAHVDDGDKKAFVIQFTKNRFFADPFEINHDTYVNFQLWFFENGVLEVHFGELHMDGSPIYEPGKGFYEYTSSGGVDTTYVAGPHMSISNPLNEEDAIGLQGAYNDFEIVDNPYADLTLLPPEGWIIQFKPINVSTEDFQNRYEQFQVSPNPTNSFIHIPNGDSKVLIFNNIGQLIFEGYAKDDLLEISTLRAGMYYIHIKSPEKVSTGVFIKQ